MSDNNSCARHWALIPAAGVGRRMAADRPKQYLKLFDRTILEHTLMRFTEDGRFSGVYVGVSAEDAYWSNLPASSDSSVTMFEGGDERLHTVLQGLHALHKIADPRDWVWVHDAARPCLSHQDIDALFAQIDSRECDGALLAARIYDTVKQANTQQQSGQTLDREFIWRALTPQVFRIGQLSEALERCLGEGYLVTDDASAMEHCGYAPELIQASAENLKITHPHDLKQAAQIMQNQAINPLAVLPRVGSGFDVHAFEEGEFVTLGGVRIPHGQGLKAHSDGDVALHALMDALLGALSLGDIGHHFPDTDMRWKGADSRVLLREVCAILAGEGYAVGNVDLTIIAERPKMAPHIEAMRTCISEDLKLEIGQVSVKATTTERLGFTGRQEGIACQATALVYRSGM